MKTSTHEEILNLVDRLARVSASEHWVGEINPAQLAALSYLAMANRYSRAPSQIAEYLSAMRGTVSVTLKSLARKNLIKETKSKADKRRTSYSITEKGLASLDFDTSLNTALDTMDKGELSQLSGALKTLLKNVLRVRGGRSFGVCATCQHHRNEPNGAFCKLLDVDLKTSQTKQICFEHERSKQQSFP